MTLAAKSFAESVGLDSAASRDCYADGLAVYGDVRAEAITGNETEEERRIALEWVSAVVNAGRRIQRERREAAPHRVVSLEERLLRSVAIFEAAASDKEGT